MAHTKDAISSVSQAAHTAGGYVEHAAEQLREGVSEVAARTREGYQRAEDVVRHNPTPSIATGFTAGLVLGVLIGLSVAHRWR
jgi:ElaB/YqjD/DUF883 family membrane-anchored ribosome-binding protein